MSNPIAAVTEAVNSQLTPWKPASAQEFYRFLLELPVLIDGLDEAVSAVFGAAAQDGNEHIDDIRSSLLAASRAAQEAESDYHQEYRFFLDSSE
jgi:hypothetical protein